VWRSLTFRDEFFEDGHARHNIPAIIVPRGWCVAVTVLRARDGSAHTTIVTARGDLELLLSADAREHLLCLLDVGCEHACAKLDERIRIGLPRTVVPGLPRNRMLDVDLDDSNAMGFAVHKVAQFVDAVCLATCNGEEEGSGYAVHSSMLREEGGESRMMQPV
jgi:hypothetical protein